ncbi:predicted protein [Sclerotinia sclerotiorum 1980 UF-70]|uniref:Uncharacterized protein n=2 Tax=Sclerotinia sclerotiorum (strain ATCC 18683 / 1980 / Ss-1) TaxID=665079 RepID=A0A1D9QJC2_SCLS1|nr:predicted protein [Sclerotinia sclerotiorum 1980 UF-70]APA15030.1 hypothetical protein sscle_14g098000 [Sclerotinia sclerotiorum 1980 UF-70]EDN98767.1 predicted protein [Sclerotinia sclerotiorum 1980 UF-70]
MEPIPMLLVGNVFGIILGLKLAWSSPIRSKHTEPEADEGVGGKTWNMTSVTRCSENNGNIIEEKIQK